MSNYDRGMYRGKRVRTEQDDYWSDRDEDAIAERLASMRAANLKRFPHLRDRFAFLEVGDTLTASETERNWLPENTL